MLHRPAEGTFSLSGLIYEVLPAKKVPAAFWDKYPVCFSATSYYPSIKWHILSPETGNLGGNRNHRGLVAILKYRLDEFREPGSNEWGEYAP